MKHMTSAIPPLTSLVNIDVHTVRESGREASARWNDLHLYPGRVAYLEPQIKFS